MSSTILNSTFGKYKENIDQSGIQCGLGKDIVSKDNEKIFLKAGTPVTEKINAQIQQLKADGVISETSPDDTIEIIAPTQSKDLLSSILTTIKSNPVLTQYQLAETLETVANYVKTAELPKKIMEHFTVFSKTHPTAFEHTLSNLVFGTHIGKANNYSNSELKELMTVLFFEDIGYARLDVSLNNAYKVHPILSKEIVEYAGIDNKLILESILQHEEKLDGSGYPNKLTKIHEYAQISQIAKQHSTFIEQGEDKNYLLGKLFILGQPCDFRTGNKKNVLYEPKLQKAILKMMQEKLTSPQQLNNYAKHLHKELKNIAKWSNSEISQSAELLGIQQKIKSSLWVNKEENNPFCISSDQLGDSDLCKDFIADSINFIHQIADAVTYLNCSLHKPIERNGSPISGDTCLVMGNPSIF